MALTHTAFQIFLYLCPKIVINQKLSSDEKIHVIVAIRGIVDGLYL